jgi:TATA-binding protein-associated factor
MPRRSVFHTHSVLLQMVRQDFPIPPPRTAPSLATGRRVVKGNGHVKELTHIWEVRHAGLLGIKYEVAVRPDLVSEPVKVDEGVTVSQAALQDVVDAAILG